MTRTPLFGLALPALFVTLAACSFPTAARAWNDTGHMLTALVAWEQMDEPTRAWAVRVLEQHPRFAEDFTRRMPKDLPAADRGRWAFANAATWPDIARGFEGSDERFHHSTWHYAKAFHPLDDGDADENAAGRLRGPSTRRGTTREDAGATTTRPASTRRSRATTRPASDVPEVHIVEALNASLLALRDPAMPAAERAVSLCWVLHLTGDIHQPCHAGSLLSERFTPPEGDRGANSIVVENEGRSGNLHSVWDGMAGENRAMPVLDLKVARLLAEPTNSRAALRQELELRNAPADWLAESAVLSRVAVYDYSVRSAIRLQELDPDAPFVPIRLSRNYATDAQMIAKLRVTLAGHRIADALRDRDGDPR